MIVSEDSDKQKIRTVFAKSEFEHCDRRVLEALSALRTQIEPLAFRLSDQSTEPETIPIAVLTALAWQILGWVKDAETVVWMIGKHAVSGKKPTDEEQQLLQNLVETANDIRQSILPFDSDALEKISRAEFNELVSKAKGKLESAKTLTTYSEQEEEAEEAEENVEQTDLEYDNFHPQSDSNPKDKDQKANKPTASRTTGPQATPSDGKAHVPTDKVEFDDEKDTDFYADYFDRIFAKRSSQIRSRETTEPDHQPQLRAEAKTTPPEQPTRNAADLPRTDQRSGRLKLVVILLLILLVGVSLVSISRESWMQALNKLGFSEQELTDSAKQLNAQPNESLPGVDLDGAVADSLTTENNRKTDSAAEDQSFRDTGEESEDVSGMLREEVSTVETPSNVTDDGTTMETDDLLAVMDLIAELDRQATLATTETTESGSISNDVDNTQAVPDQISEPQVEAISAPENATAAEETSRDSESAQAALPEPASDNDSASIPQESINGLPIPAGFSNVTLDNAGFSIQLASLTRPESVNRFVSDPMLTDQDIFLRVSGRYYGVLYGFFEDRTLAQEALDLLPERFVRDQAWIIQLEKDRELFQRTAR